MPDQAKSSGFITDNQAEYELRLKMQASQLEELQAKLLDIRSSHI
jgi:hypothetical protein